MPSSPEPNHPLILPSATFTIPPPSQNQRSIQRPSLNIKLTAHVLIPTPLILEGATGHGLENCLDLVVPIGGKVGIGLEVRTEDLFGSDPSLSAKLDAEEEVRRKVKETFEIVSTARAISYRRSYYIQNKVPLGLRSTYAPFRGDDPSTSSSSPDAYTRPVLLLELDPVAACPSHTPTAGHLIPSGHPTAYLTKVDIHIGWTPFCRPRSKIRKKLEAEENEINDADESQAIETQEEEAVDEKSPINNDQDGLLPSWALVQLKIGLAELVRKHFIR